MNKLTVICMLLLVSGCGTVSNMTVSEEVKPWERDVLATDTMQLPPDNMQFYLDSHIYFSKEASTGGGVVGGGGCGCN